jgi:hypothetical protein
VGKTTFIWTHGVKIKLGFPGMKVLQFLLQPAAKGKGRGKGKRFPRQFNIAVTHQL